MLPETRNSPVLYLQPAASAAVPATEAVGDAAGKDQAQPAAPATPTASEASADEKRGKEPDSAAATPGSPQAGTKQDGGGSGGGGASGGSHKKSGKGKKGKGKHK